MPPSSARSRFWSPWWTRRRERCATRGRASTSRTSKAWRLLFPFDATRNPVYACLLFVFIPALAVLIDSAWPLVFLPLLYAYVSDIVIPAEEAQLLSAFGAKAAKYAAATPRLSATGLARAAPTE